MASQFTLCWAPWRRLLLAAIAPVLLISACSDFGQSKASNYFSDPKVLELAAAIRKSDFQRAGQLVKEGADPNAMGKDNVTLALWCMLNGDKKGFEWLFRHGADPNLVPPVGGGVLHRSVAETDSWWLETLLRHKADPNLTYNQFGMIHTAMDSAAMFRRKRHLELLIGAGADVNRESPASQGAGTPVIMAAGVGWFEGVHILLMAGADHRPRTTGGEDLVDIVVKRTVSPGSEDAKWREEVLKVLKDRGVPTPTPSTLPKPHQTN